MMFIGNHLSCSKGFLAMGKAAEKLGADTFAFFTRNPRGGQAKDIDPADAAALMKFMEEKGFGKLVAHAPYTMNVCAAKDDVREFSKRILKEDLIRMEYVPGNFYNFHPGSHVGNGPEIAVKMIADAINEAIPDECNTTVLLETMAGKGSEVGCTFEELRQIIDLVERKDLIGVCFDTCHVWDAGYDIVNNLDGVLDEFDKVLGIDRLKAVHFNDSMNPINSHKDRHAVIGGGFIGKDAMARVVLHPALKDKPFILETPNDDEGYKQEIDWVKSIRV